MTMRVVCVVCAGFFLSACASIISGTDQDITFTSNPEGAACDVVRNGETLAQVTTPETINVKKTKHDITVACNMGGFHESTVFVKSEIQDSTWGNIVAGGGIGWAVDSARGADNKYAAYVTVTMVPLSEAAPEAETILPEGAPEGAEGAPEGEPDPAGEGEPNGSGESGGVQ